MIPIISPGPSLPFSIILDSSTVTIPVSEPTYMRLSREIEYLIGRNPFLSIPPTIQFPSTAAIAAGPSQGSTIAFENSYIFLCSIGISSLLFDQASGIKRVFTRGTDLPALTYNSNAASKADESETFFSIIGLTCSLSSPKISVVILVW